MIQILVNVTVLVLGLFGHGGFSQTAEDYFCKAVRFYYVEQDKEKAIAQLKEALRIDPSYQKAKEFNHLISAKIEVETSPAVEVAAKGKPFPSIEIGQEPVPEDNKQVVQLLDPDAEREVSEFEEGDREREEVGFEEEIKAERSRNKVAYYIEPEDELEISVWRVDELNRDVIVRPDGAMSFPLIGEIKAAGLTIKDLSHEIGARLSEYVRSPQVFVSVKKFSGKKVLVMGEVEKQGIYRYTGDIKVSEAVALAGGFTEDAKIRNVIIIRGDLLREPQGIIVNFKEMIGRIDLKQDISIQPMDTVYVPRTFIANVNAFLRQLRPGVDILYSGEITRQLVTDK